MDNGYAGNKKTWPSPMTEKKTDNQTAKQSIMN